MFPSMNEASDKCWGKSRNPGVLEIIILKLFFPVSNLRSDSMTSFQFMSSSASYHDMLFSNTGLLNSQGDRQSPP